MDKQQLDLDKITFAVEPLHQIKDEIKTLIELHYQELEWTKSVALNPDWEKYEYADNNGSLAIFTARDEDLIGYNVFFLNESLHYKGLKQAIQDLIFIHPDKRGFGKYFIYWCDEKLKEIGMQRVYYHLKASNNFGPSLLEPMGYKLIDHVYGKEF